MKTQPFQSQRGGVLVITLVIALLVGLAVGAIMVLVQQQNYLTARSQTWSSEIPLAEAGIEEAMAHLNTRPTRFDTNGWTMSGNAVTKHRAFVDGYYYTTMTTSLPPIIVSIGYGRIPLQTGYTHRTVMAMTRLTAPAWGIVAKQNISMDGTTVYVDSFDSSDPRYSTNGNYHPDFRRDRAGVATLSTNVNAIDSKGAEIYGSVSTGPGGTAVGNVGDGAWISGGNMGIQEGHFSDDFNMAIDNVIVPSELLAATAPSTVSSGGLLGGLLGTLYSTLGFTPRFHLTGGDYAFNSGLDLNNQVLLVQGTNRIYVNGPLRVTGGSGKIHIEPGASLEIFANGNIDVGGGGIVNGANVAAACVIRGTTACTSVKYAGHAELRAVMYVPQATLEMVGTTDFCGSIVANIISFKGTPAIHYDEALTAGRPDYRISSWQELAN